MGYVSIRKIKFIPGIKIEHVKDSKHERGDINIELKNSFWSIGFYYKGLTYSPLIKEGGKHLNINLDITEESLKIIYEKDKKTGKFYVKEKPEWLINDYGTEFKIITHPIDEIEEAEELLEPKLIKNTPETILEYYDKSKILKIPYFNDEIRINIENENLEYIRKNKKIIKVFPLNKEIHFYGIEPRVRKYIVTSQGARLANQNTN
jgi:hypothetical protein